MSAEPGWFQDPQRPPGHLRWWDGEAWTEQRVAPHDAPVPAAWSPFGFVRWHPLSAIVVAVFAALVVYGAAESAGEQSGGRNTAPGSNEADLVADPDPEPKTRVQTRERVASGHPPKPAPRTYLVTRIVDGDTLRLGNGQTVRLVGIDTPEAGACGSERASDALARLVLGEQVLLRLSDGGRDRYGRLLRYVDIGTQDAALRLIKNGLAVARYDSRDGYGPHPREQLYIAADKVSRQVSCAPRSQPLTRAPAGGNCAPGYTPCVPPYPPDVDCPDIDGPIKVTGSDPHGLDADGDGVACE